MLHAKPQKQPDWMRVGSVAFMMAWMRSRHSRRAPRRSTALRCMIEAHGGCGRTTACRYGDVASNEALTAAWKAHLFLRLARTPQTIPNTCNGNEGSCETGVSIFVYPIRRDSLPTLPYRPDDHGQGHRSPLLHSLINCHIFRESFCSCNLDRCTTPP